MPHLYVDFYAAKCNVQSRDLTEVERERVAGRTRTLPTDGDFPPLDLATGAATGAAPLLPVQTIQTPGS